MLSLRRGEGCGGEGCGGEGLLQMWDFICSPIPSLRHWSAKSMNFLYSKRNESPKVRGLSLFPPPHPYTSVVLFMGEFQFFNFQFALL